MAQGLRLIYVQPLTRDGARVGSIAVERPLPSIEDSGRGTGSLQGTGEDAFRIPTTLAPVSIQLPFEGAPPAGDDATFDVQAPSGERLLTASVAAADLATTRERWRRATRSLMLVILAITLLVLTAPLLDWRNRLRSPAAYSLAVLLVVTCIVAARFLFFAAAPADWSDALVFSTAYASALIGSLLASPFDFVLTAGAAVAIVVLLLYSCEAWRVYAWRRRQSASGGGRRLTYVTSQLLVGVIVAVVLLGHEALLRDTVSNTRLDLLQLSLNPWNTARIRDAGRPPPCARGRARIVRARASHRPPRMAHSTTADPASSPDHRVLATAAARMADDAEPAGRTTSAAADGRRGGRRPGSGAAPIGRTVSARLAGLSPDAAHAAVDCSRFCVLSHRCAARQAGQDRARRDTLRTGGSQSATDGPVGAAEKPGRDRPLCGPRRARDHALSFRGQRR